MLKVDSMKMLPVMRFGTSVAKAVIMGICALRSTCRNISIRSDTPLARAVRV